MTKRKAPALSFGDTELHEWFERDRAHVELRNKKTQKTIVEWWDEAVAEAVDDGFLKTRALHRSAYDYAKEVGLLTAPTPYTGRLKSRLTS